MSVEKYESENVFFLGSQSAYVYNSLADFYADANDVAANPNRTTSPVTLRRVPGALEQHPGPREAVQPLEVLYGGGYLQDEWRPTNSLTITAGVRFDVPRFGETGYTNSVADALTFRDETGAPISYDTGEMPSTKLLWSPRVGVNWDVFGDQSTQLRGGGGLFSGRPAYVWISNQIGNTGVLTGFEQLDNTTARPFNPDPNRYKPANVTGAPASSFELALNVTDPDFKFPQLWRTNIAVDQRCPRLHEHDRVHLQQGRQRRLLHQRQPPAAQSSFAGVDNRPRWVGTACAATGQAGGCVNRINSGRQRRRAEEPERGIVVEHRATSLDQQFRRQLR